MLNILLRKILQNFVKTTFSKVIYTMFDSVEQLSVSVRETAKFVIITEFGYFLRIQKVKNSEFREKKLFSYRSDALGPGSKRSLFI